jgi:hypothetical protein
MARPARRARDDPLGSKKNVLRPHRVKQWVIPPKQNAAFVAAMERVLAVYAEPYDVRRPVVCLDSLPRLRGTTVRASR